MNVKVLGVGCSVCQSMYNTVTQIVAREHMEAEVEYVTDIDKILSYGVLSTPALVINDRVSEAQGKLSKRCVRPARGEQRNWFYSLRRFYFGIYS